MSESENQKQKPRRRRCGEYFREAKKVLIRCGKKESIKKKNQKPSPCSSDNNDNAGIYGKRSLVLHRCFCCFFKQPSTLESYAESMTSDPNDYKFTFEMLKNLIEKNDFYSKDCNPHLDPPSSSFPSDDLI